MNTKRTYRKQSETFGPWLRSKIAAAGMTQGEFAKRVGASKSSVSRWVAGRVPEASFIDLIADVLLLDYDSVAERAGYRPRLPKERVDEIHDDFDHLLIKLAPDDYQAVLRMAQAFARGSDIRASGQIDPSAQARGQSSETGDSDRNEG